METFNRMNSKAYMNAVRAYVKEWKEDYEIGSLAEKFANELPWKIEREGFNKAADYWFAGCVAPAVYENQIIPIIAEWRGCSVEFLKEKVKNNSWLYFWQEYTGALKKVLREEFEKEYTLTPFMRGNRLFWSIKKK
jgi:hypothetical protein